MSARRGLTGQVYRALVRLYPADFRREFGDELEGVLARVARDCASAPWPDRLRRSAGELMALLTGAAREHWQPALRPAGGQSTPDQAGVMPRLAVAIGLTYTLTRLIAFFVPWPSDLTYLAGGLLFGVCLKGAMRGRRGLPIVTGVGLFLGGSMLARLARAGLCQLAGAPDALILAAFYLGEPLVIGFLAGALLGLITRSRRRLVMLSGLGLAGFGGGLVLAIVLSFLAWGLVQAIDSYRPGNTGVPSAWVFLVGDWLKAVLFPSLAVLIGSLVLGRAARPRTAHP